MMNLFKRMFASKSSSDISSSSQLAETVGAAEQIKNLGNEQLTQGNQEQAITLYREAIKLNPRYAQAYNNIGVALLGLERYDEAASHFRQALAINPELPQAHGNLGNTLQSLGQTAAAVASFRRALEIDPNQVGVLSNLGITLKSLGQIDAAVASLRRALELDPNFADAHCYLGCIQQDFRQFDTAVASFRRAIELDPDHAVAHNNLGNALSSLGQVDAGLASLHRALKINPEFSEAHSNLLFYQSYLPDKPTAAILEEARNYSRIVASHAEPFSTWQSTPDPSRHLRIGFVSGDLLEHPVGYFLENVLGELSKKNFDLVAYPTNTKEDTLSQRIRHYFAAWKSSAGMSNEKFAQMIHDDAIDILIDLSGHTAGNRLPVFAWKPAPVQISWLGYCATTGVSTIDYYIADSWALSPSQENQFTESIWRLPESYLCLSRPTTGLEVSELPALTAGYLTFGSFNNLIKINDAVVTLWARVLKAVPGSRLLLKAWQLDEAPVRQNVLERFAAQGIGADRLMLQGNIPDRSNHLDTYNQIDIGLDPFPYNGVTTTAEALWMGVPVLTLAGERFLSRQGISLLMNAGLPEWIAHDVDDYVARAKAHATNLDRLATLRKGLRQQLLASSLFNAPRFVNHFETALRDMWAIFCKKH